MADAVAACAAKKRAMKNWKEVANAVTAYVTRSRAEKKIEEEVTTVADAGTACVTRFDPIFSFHGDSLLAVDISEH